MENTNSAASPPPPPPKSKVKGDAVFENVLKIAAYPVSVISGYLVGDNYIRKGSYKNFARHGVFDDIQAQRKERFHTLLQELPSGKAIGNVSRTVQQIEKIYRADVKARFEQMGLHGLPDYWKTLHRDQKIDTLVMSATAAGIAIGAMLTIAHEKDWVKSLAKDQRQEDQGLAP